MTNRTIYKSPVQSGGATAVPEPVAAGTGEYDESGVDLTLLRWMIGLSPRQRLVIMEQHARDTERLLEYGRRHREAKARSGR